MFERVPISNKVKMHNIAVIGCGIIGLTTATVIQNELKCSVKITIFTEKVTPNTTSDIAAGLWSPYAVLDTKMEKTQQWGKDTHDHLLKLWKSELAAEAGITLQLVKQLYTDDHVISSGCENIAYGFQKIPPGELKKLQKQHQKNYKHGSSYVSFTCEPQIHLPFLHKQFISNGGVINIKKVDDIGQLSGYDVVINCTGINAKGLCNDDKVVSIRGQIARVKAPWQFHSLFSDNNYTIPNCNNIVLGGTAQLGDWDTNPRKSDKESILNGVYNTIPSLKNAPILAHMVGLRPARSEVRLEMEMKRIDGKKVPVIHNYGHGGAGVTFSYGCALEVLGLVKDVLNVSRVSKL